jgi:hypothetical protein
MPFNGVATFELFIENDHLDLEYRPISPSSYNAKNRKKKEKRKEKKKSTPNPHQNQQNSNHIMIITVFLYPALWHIKNIFFK